MPLDLYCEAWPPELKEAQREWYRAECKRRCLEAHITRIDPEEFDEAMASLESAAAEVLICARKAQGLYWDYCSQEYPFKNG